MNRYSKPLNGWGDAQEEAEARPNSLRSSHLAEAQDGDCSCPRDLRVINVVSGKKGKEEKQLGKVST